MNKGKVIIKEVYNNIVLFLMLIILAFVVPRLIPGSPICSFQENYHVLNATLPEDTFNRFSEYYSPHESMGRQFIIYIRNLGRLDLGYSLYYGYPVFDIIKGRIGWTLLISIMSIVISLIITIPLAIKSGLSNNVKLKKFLMISFVALQAIPIFIIALLIQRVFAYRLNLFPSQGAYSPGLGLFDKGFLSSSLRHMILPLGALLISQIPANYILITNIIEKIKKEPYVELAYFNNLDGATIRYKYILRNSMPEILSKLNIHFVYAIAGALFIEMIFSYPGIGVLLRIALSSRDYPLVQGIFIFTSAYGIMVNMLFGIILSKVNPRL